MGEKTSNSSAVLFAIKILFLTALFSYTFWIYANVENSDFQDIESFVRELSQNPYSPDNQNTLNSILIEPRNVYQYSPHVRLNSELITGNSIYTGDIAESERNRRTALRELTLARLISSGLAKADDAYSFYSVEAQSEKKTLDNTLPGQTEKIAEMQFPLAAQFYYNSVNKDSENPLHQKMYQRFQEDHQEKAVILNAHQTKVYGNCHGKESNRSVSIVGLSPLGTGTNGSQSDIITHTLTWPKKMGDNLDSIAVCEKKLAELQNALKEAGSGQLLLLGNAQDLELSSLSTPLEEMASDVSLWHSIAAPGEDPLTLKNMVEKAFPNALSSINFLNLDDACQADLEGQYQKLGLNYSANPVPAASFVQSPPFKLFMRDYVACMKITEDKYQKHVAAQNEMHRLINEKRVQLMHSPAIDQDDPGAINKELLEYQKHLLQSNEAFDTETPRRPSNGLQLDYDDESLYYQGEELKAHNEEQARQREISDTIAKINEFVEFEKSHFARRNDAINTVAYQVGSEAGEEYWRSTSDGRAPYYGKTRENDSDNDPFFYHSLEKPRVADQAKEDFAHKHGNFHEFAVIKTNGKIDDIKSQILDELYGPRRNEIIAALQNNSSAFFDQYRPELEAMYNDAYTYSMNRYLNPDRKSGQLIIYEEEDKKRSALFAERDRIEEIYKPEKATPSSTLLTENKGPSPSPEANSISLNTAFRLSARLPIATGELPKRTAQVLPEVRKRNFTGQELSAAEKFADQFYSHMLSEVRRDEVAYAGNREDSYDYIHRKVMPTIRQLAYKRYLDELAKGVNTPQPKITYQEIMNALPQ